MTTVIFLLAAIACLIVPNLWIFLLIFAAALFLFGVRNPRTGQVLFAEILGMKVHPENGQIAATKKELLAEYERNHPNLGKEPIL